MKVKLIVFLIALLVFAYSSQAATIHGSIYTPYFSLIKNAELEINTTPNQNQISKNGLYFFYVPPGSYRINAKKYYNGQIVFSASQAIEIDKDGEYTIDIITTQAPGTEIPPEDKDEPKEFFLMLQSKLGYFFYVIILILIIVIAVLTFFIANLIIQKKKKEAKSAVVEVPDMLHKIETDYTTSSVHIEPSKAEEHKEEKKEEHPQDTALDLGTVLKIIKEEGGRTTQKDIRKKIPLSEAKVSLMISELEAKGKIEKIKKGRGNIIILKS
jgi:uncharacterized membrane protein